MKAEKFIATNPGSHHQPRRSESRQIMPKPIRANINISRPSLTTFPAPAAACTADPGTAFLNRGGQRPSEVLYGVRPKKSHSARAGRPARRESTTLGPALLRRYTHIPRPRMRPDLIPSVDAYTQGSRVTSIQNATPYSTACEHTHARGKLPTWHQTPLPCPYSWEHPRDGRPSCCRRVLPLPVRVPRR